MKKKYSIPKIILIGDMANNTLGSSGTVADNGTFQANANGGEGNSNQNTSSNDGGLESDSFSNDSFSN